jgi:hypothetical protein
VSERRKVDPSRAEVDLDMVTLIDHILIDQESETGSFEIHVQLIFEGGLGLLRPPNGNIVHVQELTSMQVTSTYPALSGEESDALTRLLGRWQRASMPLRFLDFGDHALLLEDGDNVINLPPGARKLQIVQGNGNLGI